MRWLQPTQENKETVPPSFCPCFKHLSGYFPECWDETRTRRAVTKREGNVAATTWKRVVAAATAHPSGSTPSRTLSTGPPITEVQDLPVGHKSDGWQVMYLSAPRSIVAPGARRLPCPADAPHCRDEEEVVQETRGIHAGPANPSFPCDTGWSAYAEVNINWSQNQLRTIRHHIACNTGDTNSGPS